MENVFYSVINRRFDDNGRIYLKLKNKIEDKIVIRPKVVENYCYLEGILKKSLEKNTINYQDVLSPIEVIPDFQNRILIPKFYRELINTNPKGVVYMGCGDYFKLFSYEDGVKIFLQN